MPYGNIDRYKFPSNDRSETCPPCESAGSGYILIVLLGLLVIFACKTLG
jgi:hypothetical protein